MNIGFILHPYGEDAPAGLGRATLKIIESLIAHDTANHYIVYLRRRPKILPTFAGSNWEIKILGYSFLWLDRGLWGEKLDVCYFNTPILPFFVHPKRSIVILYDFAYRYFEHSRFLAWYHCRSLHRAAHVISISEFTKQEAIKFCSIAPQKIDVALLGYESRRVTEDGLPASAKVGILPQKFFLFAGVIKERKNVFGIVQAYELLLGRGIRSHVLVIAGRCEGAYYEMIRRYVVNRKLEASVLFLDYVSDADLAHIYSRAEAVVYPSFIEGFGFPVLEAFDVGVPIISSTTSSLPEVAGDAALLVNPTSIEEICGAMVRILTEPGLRASLIAKGREQVKKFSWDRFANTVLSIVSRL